MSVRRIAPFAASVVTAPARPLVKRPDKCKYKTVLTIDGGGARGIVPVMVLQHLENSIKEHIFENRQRLIPPEARDRVNDIADFDVDLTDYFDLVAGTSIGSWIATYIAARGSGCDGILNDKRLQETYGPLRRGSIEIGRIALREFAQEVFPRRNIFDTVAGVLFRARYPQKGLMRVLNLMFGDAKMSDMETGCLVTAYDLGKNAACSFLRGPDKETYTVRAKVRECTRTSKSDGRRSGEFFSDLSQDLDVIPHRANFLLRDITHASSSAPVFFEPARIKQLDADNAEELTLVDGGTVANNPTLQALTYAPSSFSGGSIRNVAVFSVGCATVDPDSRRRIDPGLAWWVLSGYLQNMLTEGTGEYIQAVMDYWLYKILELPPGQYVRIQKNAKPGSDEAELVGPMDVPENIPGLEDLGRNLAKDNDADIKRFVEDFMFATKD